MVHVIHHPGEEDDDKSAAKGPQDREPVRYVRVGPGQDSRAVTKAQSHDPVVLSSFVVDFEDTDDEVLQRNDVVQVASEDRKYHRALDDLHEDVAASGKSGSIREQVDFQANKVLSYRKVSQGGRNEVKHEEGDTVPERSFPQSLLSRILHVRGHLVVRPDTVIREDKNPEVCGVAPYVVSEGLVGRLVLSDVAISLDHNHHYQQDDDYQRHRCHVPQLVQSLRSTGQEQNGSQEEVEYSTHDVRGLAGHCEADPAGDRVFKQIFKELPDDQVVGYKSSHEVEHEHQPEDQAPFLSHEVVDHVSVVLQLGVSDHGASQEVQRVGHVQSCQADHQQPADVAPRRGCLGQGQEASAKSATEESNEPSSDRGRVDFGAGALGPGSAFLGVLFEGRRLLSGFAVVLLGVVRDR